MIAFKMYPDKGGEHLMNVLLDANLAYCALAVLPADLVLNVPDVETPTAALLPPWKRR
jgi:hypothetical protein